MTVIGKYLLMAAIVLLSFVAACTVGAEERTTEPVDAEFAVRIACAAVFIVREMSAQTGRVYGSDEIENWMLSCAKAGSSVVKQ